MPNEANKSLDTQINLSACVFPISPPRKASFFCYTGEGLKRVRDIWGAITLCKSGVHFGRSAGVQQPEQSSEPELGRLAGADAHAELFFFFLSKIE